MKPFLAVALELIILPISLSAAWTDSWEEKLAEKINNNERPAWMLERINKDLEPFKKNGITEAEIDKLYIDTYKSLWRCRIVDGELYVYDGRPSDFIGKAVRVLSKIKKLPDLDLLITGLDAFYHSPGLLNCGPIFSFAKRESDQGIILFPDSRVLTGYKGIIDEVYRGNNLYPWEKKEEKAFWRGVNSGFLPGNLAYMNPETYLLYPRCRLVKMSLENPSYVDARFNMILHVTNEMSSLLEKEGFTGSGVVVAEHLKYKYQVLVDGYSCAFHRAVWQLYSNCLIFKQTSPDIQWYYDALQPYVHYVPIENDISDLIEKIDWARKNDDMAKMIVKNANQFAETSLNEEDVYHYIYLLLTEYAKLMR